MPEIRFLKILIAALLLLNAGTLAYLWIGHRHGPEGHEPHEGRPGDMGPRENAADYLRHTLQLSDDQERAYRKLRESHHENVIRIRDDMRVQKRALYGLMHSPDTAAITMRSTAMLDSLGAGQRDIERITFAHFREVRALCTPAQQQKFDEVIGEALERMR